MGRPITLPEFSEWTSYRLHHQRAFPWASDLLNYHIQFRNFVPIIRVCEFCFSVLTPIINPASFLMQDERKRRKTGTICEALIVSKGIHWLNWIDKTTANSWPCLKPQTYVKSWRNDMRNGRHNYLVDTVPGTVITGLLKACCRWHACENLLL